MAGGLTSLSKMPACNIQLLGNQKRTLSGFSQTATLPHTGFIFQSPIVQDTPPVSLVILPAFHLLQDTDLTYGTGSSEESGSFNFV